MAEIVDSIVAELIARDNGYITTFDRAITKHKEFTASVPKIDGIEMLSKGAKQYADQHAQSLGKVVKDEEQASQRITATRKKRVAEAKASDEAEVVSAKKAAKAKADAEIAEAERSARYRRMAERAVTNRTLPAGSGRIPNPDLSRGGSPLFIPAAALAGAGEAEELKEVDYLTRDIALNKARLAIAEGKEAETLQREIIYLETINRLKKAGVAETEATALAEAAAAKAQQAHGGGLFRRSANRGGLGQANQFALGASRGRFGYSFTPGALAGVGAAIGIGVGVEAINSATQYGQALSEVSKQAGLSAESLQVYQHAALQAGVDSDQFDQALRSFTENLGKARTGSQEQSKAFAALGIDIHTAATAGDLLPTLIDRISSIPDAAQRARVETALFGETGAKLDSMLSGGNEKINDLAAALENTGSVLSSSDIARLDEVSKKLAAVKAQLMVDMAEVVANNADAIKKLASAFSSLANSIPNALKWLDQVGAKLDIANGRAKLYAGMGMGNPLLMQSGLAELRSGQARLDATDPRNGLTGSTSPGLLARIKAGGSAVQPGGVNQHLLDNLGTPKGRTHKAHGPTPEQISADIEARDQRLDAETLAAKAEMTQSAEDRAAAANAQLDAERASYARSLADDKKLSAADRKRLLAREDQVIAAKREKVDQDRLHQIATEDFQLADDKRAAQIEELQAQLALATTAKQRRDLEQQILRATQDRRLAELNHQLDVGTPAEQERALKEEARLPGIAARKSVEIDAQTRGPLADYLSQLPRDAGRLDEALQEASVHGLQNLNDGLSTAVDRFLHLHGIAGQFLSDLIKIGIEREFLIPIANELFPTASKEAGGSTSGGVLNTVVSAIGSFFGGHRAAGGPVMPGQFYEVGERGRELFAPQVPGNIIPNNAINIAPMNHRLAQPAAPTRPTEIVLHVQSNDYFDARVHRISSAVAADTSVRVVQAAAPGIARAGAQASPQVIQRQQKLGPS